MIGQDDYRGYSSGRDMKGIIGVCHPIIFSSMSLLCNYMCT